MTIVQQVVRDVSCLSCCAFPLGGPVGLLTRFFACVLYTRHLSFAASVLMSMPPHRPCPQLCRKALLRHHHHRLLLFPYPPRPRPLRPWSPQRPRRRPRFPGWAVGRDRVSASPNVFIASHRWTVSLRLPVQSTETSSAVAAPVEVGRVGPAQVHHRLRRLLKRADFSPISSARSVLLAPRCGVDLKILRVFIYWRLGRSPLQAAAAAVGAIAPRGSPADHPTSASPSSSPSRPPTTRTAPLYTAVSVTSDATRAFIPHIAPSGDSGTSDNPPESHGINDPSAAMATPGSAAIPRDDARNSSVPDGALQRPALRPPPRHPGMTVGPTEPSAIPCGEDSQDIIGEELRRLVSRGTSAQSEKEG